MLSGVTILPGSEPVEDRHVWRSNATSTAAQHWHHKASSRSASRLTSWRLPEREEGYLPSGDAGTDAGRGGEKNSYLLRRLVIKVRSAIASTAEASSQLFNNLQQRVSDPARFAVGGQITGTHINVNWSSSLGRRPRTSTLKNWWLKCQLLVLYGPEQSAVARVRVQQCRRCVRHRNLVL